MKLKSLSIYFILFAPLFSLLNSVFAGVSDNCVTKTDTLEVHGTSLAPLIDPGQIINLLYGYYNCHPIERGDIVAYDYAGNPAPIIKIVKAVPGDKWQLVKDKESYLIAVNAKPLLNSQGRAYQIPESDARMLKLYAESYPVLPENAYLILGNNISGSFDATRFGLIGKNDILGKVVKQIKKRGQSDFL